MNLARYIHPLCAAGAALSFACNALVFGSSSYEKVNQTRAQEQTHFEDSANVFFATYHNPYQDRTFLWFAVFGDGAVEMRVHDIETDSLQYVYRFEKQDTPVYTIPMHEDSSHLVKCVLIVDGRRKCAKVYQAWTPLQIPQFKTQYTVDTK